MASFYRMVGSVRVAKVPAKGFSTTAAVVDALCKAIPVYIRPGSKFRIELDGKFCADGVLGLSTKAPEPVKLGSYEEELAAAAGMWKELMS